MTRDPEHIAWTQTRRPGEDFATWRGRMASSTLACRVLDAIEAEAIRHLPGYDDAPWGLTDAHVGRAG